MKNTCKICGKEFESNRKRSICQDPHPKICVYCGKQFFVTSMNYSTMCCSVDCRFNYRNKQNKTITSTCRICGDTFLTSSTSCDICDKDHVMHCEICGKEFHICLPNKSYKTTCSKKCAAELRARQCEQKYGVRSSFQRPEIKEKIKKTNLEKFGSENPLGSPVIRERIKKTCLEKYGVEFATQSEQMKSNSRKTNLERYGFESAAQSPEVQEKMKQTNIERYGVDNIFKSSDFRDHTKDVMQERYGVDYYTQTEEFKDKKDKAWEEKYGGNPWSNNEIRLKCNETNLERYGDIWPQRTMKVRQKQIDTLIANRARTMPDDSVRKNYLEFKSDPVAYIRKHKIGGINMSEIAQQLGYADPTILYEEVHKNNEESLLRWSGMSKMERDIQDFLKSLDNTLDIQVHNRSVIPPKEIDLYLPQYKVGIECNPTITHNSTYVLANVLGTDSDNTYVTPEDYHLVKTTLCENTGVFLFHVFGYEWTNHQDVILSMIRNLIGKTEYKYYARNLVVKDATPKEANEFLNENHRQGSAPSSIRLGLYDTNDELLSLMTFGHMRPTIGFTNSDTGDSIELVRFCNKINTSVVGGASKLFSHFLKIYHPSKVISFSDRAHTRGDLYKILGFVPIRTSDPNYVWVNLTTNLYFNRVSCQKNKLPKLFNEPDLDIKNQTEKQIMSSRGFVQVFDSGTVRWEYTNSLNR